MSRSSSRRVATVRLRMRRTADPGAYDIEGCLMERHESFEAIDSLQLYGMRARLR